MGLAAESIDVANDGEAVELFYERGWTDGLPVVPPTEEKVLAMLKYAGRDAQESLGEVPPYGGMATIEKIAINAVMAGCRPEYFPVVLAAVEASLDPGHNLNGTQTTQDGGEELIIVSGPITKELKINSGDSVFGHGFRANGTIGRALRLVFWNLGRSFPGDPDRSVLSHPGSWTFCIAEDVEGSPWEPLHVERGLSANISAVTVFQCEAPNPFLTHGTVKQVLFTACEVMKNPASGNRIFFAEGESLLVFSPLVAEQFRKEGWSKQDVKKYVWENSKIPYWKVENTGMLTAPESGGTNFADLWWPKWIDRSDPNALIPTTPSPDNIHIIVAGGRGPWSAVCEGWGAGGKAITKEIKLP